MTDTTTAQFGLTATREFTTKRTVKGLLKAKGRPNPAAPQSLIVISVNGDQDEIPRTKNNAESYAPYTSDEAAKQLRRGEIGWVEVDCQKMRGVLPTVTGMSALNCTTHLGGIPKSTRLIAAGIVDNPSAGNGTDSLRDNLAVVRIAGVGSTINTGSRPIHIMTPVMADPFPWLVTDPNTMEKGNAIDYSYENVPPTKMYGQTVPAVASNVFSIMRMLSFDMSAQLNKNPYPASTKTVMSWVDRVLASKMQLKQSPLHLWLHLWTARRLVFSSLVDSSDNATAQKARNQMNNIVVEYIVLKLNEYRQTETVIRQCNDRVLNNIINAQPGSEKLKIAEYLGAVNENDFVKKFKLVFKRLLPELDAAMVVLQARQQDFLDAHYLGLSLSNSQPSAPLDLSIRAGRG